MHPSTVSQTTIVRTDGKTLLGAGDKCGYTDIHSTREYADLQEMEEAYRLMLEIITQVLNLK